MIETITVPGIAAREDGRPFVVVHGGAAAQGYRNVLEALEAAVALRADYFEFDVRRVADGGLVVHHDETVGDVALRSLSFADATRAAAARGYTLPPLEQVLARARGRVRLDVEIKETGVEAATLEMISARGFTRDDFVVTSFEQPVLDAVHALDPDVMTGLLVWEVTGSEALEMFHRSSARFLGPDHAILDDGVLRAAAAAAVPLLPWTVNDRATMERLLRAEAVFGLISDDPGSALAARVRTGR